MEIRLGAHGAYHYQCHLVQIPKYRKRVLTGALKEFLTKELGEIREYHPDVEVEQFSVQADHVRLVAVIPPKYAVSAIIGKITANTSRDIRQHFPWIKKVYWRNEFWSIRRLSTLRARSPCRSATAGSARPWSRSRGRPITTRRSWIGVR